MIFTEPRISLICPSRGRPDNAARLAESAFATASGHIEIVFRLDEDDPLLCDYLTWGGPLHDQGIHVIVSPRGLLSECWNEAAEIASATVLGHMGDDIVFRTEGWDEAVLAEFSTIPDRIALVHGRDGIQDQKIATHGFYHQRWIEAVGYFMPPYFSSDFNDLWWTEVADAIGRRRYLPQVYTEHMHPAAGKGPWDQTHVERAARHQADNCDQIYRDTSSQRAADVDKLRAAITAFSERTIPA